MTMSASARIETMQRSVMRGSLQPAILHERGGGERGDLAREREDRPCSVRSSKRLEFSSPRFVQHASPCGTCPYVGRGTPDANRPSGTLNALGCAQTEAE